MRWKRLAQDNPSQRKAITNVLCAYIRMPPDLESAALVQERQVRLAAQAILLHHLQPGPDLDSPADAFWPKLDIDLTGAHLDDLELSGCSGERLLIDGVFVSGRAVFGGITFRQMSCKGTHFRGPVEFRDVKVLTYAWFDDALFCDSVQFKGVRLGSVQRKLLPPGRGTEMEYGGGMFSRTEFRDDVTFTKVQFSSLLAFMMVQFWRAVSFQECVFRGEGARILLSWVRTDVSREVASARFWPQGVAQLLDPLVEYAGDPVGPPNRPAEALWAMVGRPSSSPSTAPTESGSVPSGGA
jgi:hypothetical protein